MNVVAFDICGTIYKSNTTFDFLDYVFSRKKVYRHFRRLSQTMIWRLLNKLLRISVGLDITRIIAISFLKGYKRKELVSLAENFYDSILNYRVNKIVLARIIEELCNPNSRVVLISATIDVIAEVIANRIGCKEYYSTLLDYKNDICKGVVKMDYLGQKVNCLNKIGIVSLCSYYTDDLGDVPVLQCSKIKNVVIYSKRDERKWKKVEKGKKWHLNYIEV